MRTAFYFIIFALTVLSTTGVAQDLYDPSHIVVIEITFGRNDWDAVLDQYYAAGQEQRLPATVVIDGVRFDSAGVRYKGNSTYNASYKKNPFNIELDYVRDQKYQDYSTLKLSNVAMDPSWVRETLAYEILGKYMPSPKANFAAVYINGKYHGLYTNAQSIDKTFIREFYYSDDNPRFKCNSDAAFQTNGGTAMAYLGDDSSKYYNYYEMKSDFGWSALTGAIKGLKNTPANFEQIMDLDRTLWMHAFNSALINLDSYAGRGQNYYLYLDNSGRFSPTVWDLNMAFGSFTMLGMGGPGGQLTKTGMIQLDPLYGKDVTTRPLLKILLSDSHYRKMYIAHMRTILDEMIANQWYYQRAQQLQTLIDQMVNSDVNKFYPYSAMAQNLTSTYSGGGGMPGQSVVGITELMDARNAYLRTLDLFKAAPPSISDVRHWQTGNDAAISARISNASSVWMWYRYAPGYAFSPVSMRDDGIAPDETAGDGKYTVSAPLSGPLFQYYLYTENANAGMYDPQRAEHDYYEFAQTGDLVINEFMASNKSTVQDQDGEYEDWVELYNNSSHSIDLTGYFLSDESDNPSKWEFPAVTLHAYQYLIIWCDEDGDQDGLHASFKLSAGGEALFLANRDTVVIDQATFGDQVSDTTTGRYPNGTGPFIRMVPTFNAENTNGVTGIDRFVLPGSAALGQNYPNPFNPVTTVPFTLHRPDNIEIRIYSLLGAPVETLKRGRMEAGTYTVPWDASGYPGGVYLCIMRSSAGTDVRKLTLLK